MFYVDPEESNFQGGGNQSLGTCNQRKCFSRKWNDIARGHNFQCLIFRSEGTRVGALFDTFLEKVELDYVFIKW